MVIRSFWKVFLWLIVVTLLSCLPVKVTIEPRFLNIPHLDKIVHFIMYGILSFLLLQGLFRFRASGKHLKLIIIAITVSFTYGGLMEFIQLRFITYREGDFMDIAFNIAGAIAGSIFYEMVCQLKCKT